MSAIVDISNIFPVPPNSSGTLNSSRVVAPSSVQKEDSVEISSIGRSLANVHEPSSLNLARMQAIKSEIEKGTFETPERIMGTVDRLLHVLR